jgi:Domain of unknown function (DUF3330)
MQRAPSQPVCEVIACEICLKEIPRDLAHVQEGVGYVQYFCGIDCYAKWQAEENEPQSESVGDRPSRV